jgi:beta-lactam-binding protein with PASTA domain
MDHPSTRAWALKVATAVAAAALIAASFAGTATASPAAAPSTVTPAAVQVAVGATSLSPADVPVLSVVPDLEGMTVAEARQALSAAGFVIGSVGTAVDNSCNNVGFVFSQNPGANATVPVGTAVNIRLGAKPKPPRLCP